MTRITLLTDFGTKDGYTAAMRGVIAALAPSIIVDDASHDIPPADTRAAAWSLHSYWNLYPPGTVHVAVVDPGVGTARRALAARADGRFLVAPDNGVLTLVLQEATHATVHAIENPQWMRATVSSTFHGRDIFAPVAARLASGDALESVGPVIHDPTLLPTDEPRREGDVLTGEVVHVDRFGNLVTNITQPHIAPGAAIAIDSVQVGPLRMTYGDVGQGDLVALIGSTGRLEIAVRGNSAAEALGRGVGAKVQIAFEE